VYAQSEVRSGLRRPEGLGLGRVRIGAESTADVLVSREPIFPDSRKPPHNRFATDLTFFVR